MSSVASVRKQLQFGHPQVAGDQGLICLLPQIGQQGLSVLVFQSLNWITTTSLHLLQYACLNSPLNNAYFPSEPVRILKPHLPQKYFLNVDISKNDLCYYAIQHTLLISFYQLSFHVGMYGGNK